MDRFTVSVCSMCDDWEEQILDPKQSDKRAFLIRGKNVVLYGTKTLIRRNLGRHMEKRVLFALPRNETNKADRDTDIKRAGEVHDEKFDMSTGMMTDFAIDVWATGSEVNDENVALGQAPENIEHRKIAPKYEEMWACTASMTDMPNALAHWMGRIIRLRMIDTLGKTHVRNQREKVSRSNSSRAEMTFKPRVAEVSRLGDTTLRIDLEDRNPPYEMQLNIYQDPSVTAINFIEKSGLPSSYQEKALGFMLQYIESLREPDQALAKGSMRGIICLIDEKGEKYKAQAYSGTTDFIRSLNRRSEGNCSAGAESPGMNMKFSLGGDKPNEKADFASDHDILDHGEEGAEGQAEPGLPLEGYELTEEELRAKRGAVSKPQLNAAEDKPPENKEPIRFKNAVYHEFGFPFHLCATWKGMEELIKQGFLHIDVMVAHPTRPL
ncbi:unnamed protein product [Diplocarpon coronariae]